MAQRGNAGSFVTRRRVHTSTDTISESDRARRCDVQHGAMAACGRRHPASSLPIWPANDTRTAILMLLRAGIPPSPFFDADAARARQRTCSAFIQLASLCGRLSRARRSTSRWFLPFPLRDAHHCPRCDNPRESSLLGRLCHRSSLSRPVWCCPAIHEDSRSLSIRSDQASCQRE
ncbi:hypothetical protein DAEQUDRAFT_129217 [Daedalea quercina L-15889]|uniref:Uncharacterized protein n=1 Tax=Daedalea quercina L-15889 TaxID=1314783 RepID=A0A165S147_9APHY|nr:hypothetical protein DAEQUDRAFT_129217 [Daedalea quercina L-15889]